MQITAFETDYLCSNSYLIEENGHALIIDPCEMDAVKERIASAQLTVDHVILTHEHVDHIMGVSWAQETFGPVVLCSAICGENIQNSRKNSSYFFELFKALMTHLHQRQDVTVLPFVCHADEVFEGEKLLQWQGHTLCLHPTPGHADGSICILIDNRILFTGDTLMDDDKTVTSFVGGSMKKMQEQTLPYLRSLPRETQVYAGHFAPFQLGGRLDRGIF